MTHLSSTTPSVRRTASMGDADALTEDPTTLAKDGFESAAPVSAVDRPLEVLLWHWGRVGAAAKFTYELARELGKVPGIHQTVSAPEVSELADIVRADPTMKLRTVKSFRGDRSTWRGKLLCGIGMLGVWQLVRDFRNILRESHTDVAICAFQSIWDIAAIPFLRWGKTPFILVVHEAKFLTGDRYPFRQRVLRWEFEAADALIVLTEHMGRAAAELYNFPADRIWVVPHGAFSFGTEIAAPRKFPFDRPLRLLFFGRILKYKGLGHLLDAYRLLRQRELSVELDIVGSGDLGPYEAQLAGLPDVSITNVWVDEDQIARALARADVVILPYIEASQSGVAAAALTAGLPIVATPVGGLAEQIRDGETGVIAKGMTVDDFADAIQTLIDDPSFYDACSSGALRHVRDELGWTQIATKIADVVREVVSRPRRRAE